MKTLIPLLLFVTLQSAAQIKWYKPLFAHDDAIVYGAQVITGYSDGWREQVLYHWSALHTEFPNLNPQWWNSHISWENKKYEPELFVAFSDANHFFKATSLMTNCVSVGFSYGNLQDYPKNQRWKVIVKKIVLSYLANKLGFLLSYNITLKNHV